MSSPMIFSHYQTRPLAENETKMTMHCSSTLGLSECQVTKSTMGWQFPNGELLTFAQVKKINNEKNNCFLFINGELQKVEAFSPLTNRYYSLMPTSKAPTMLISGIPMHRIKDTTPDADTTQKIKALGKPFGRILDTATGLGYTAIAAATTADQVITIEFDPVVLKICRMNPWSDGLYNNEKILQLIGDSGDLAAMFGDSSFSGIIHDPPMFNLAGHLYSQSLYNTFYRILKPKGRLFHYIGNPESRMGASVGRGVVDRLRKSGFSVTPQPRAFGVLARK